jgi:hypothetical protein
VIEDGVWKSPHVGEEDGPLATHSFAFPFAACVDTHCHFDIGDLADHPFAQAQRNGEPLIAKGDLDLLNEDVTGFWESKGWRRNRSHKV